MSLYDDWNSTDGELQFRIVAVNDTAAPVSGLLKATIYDVALQPAWEHEYPVTIGTDAALRVAEERFRAPAANGAPLFLNLELLSGSGQRIDRDRSYYNFTAQRGSLFGRPRTTLAAEWRGRGRLALRNTGGVPAAGVTPNLGQAGFSYFASDPLFLLLPGETEEIAIEHMPAVDGRDRELEAITVSAWNAAALRVAGFRKTARAH